MRLPQAEKAVVDITKLRQYCLNPVHPRGRHKARLFDRLLGIRAEHAEILPTALLEAAAKSPAMIGERDPYGVRYVLDFTWSVAPGTVRIRSVWIIRTSEDSPRLVTSFIL
jgi:hypothetical protein